MNITSNFPFPKFHGHQERVCREIGDALDSYKYILVNAPVGAGKSPIAVAIARSFSSSHIITTQKTLQRQYKCDFSDLYVMQGKSNYQCPVEDLTLYSAENETKTCANGPCKANKGLSCYVDKDICCPFYIALHKAQESPSVLHNFASFIYQTNLAKYFNKRKVLIVDECHNIEREIMCYVGFKLTPQILGTLIPKKQTMEDYIQVIRDCEKAIKENRKKSAERIVEADKYVQGKLAVEIEEIERLLSKVNFFLNQIDRDPDNWVFNIELDEYSMVRHLEIKPVMINDYANELLFQYGEKVVCLSATVEPESFCSSLGINRDELFYIEIPSTFPIENRPIYKDYIGNISAKTIHALLPAIAEKVREYLAMYPNEKGLIHTHTFQISNYIQQHVKDQRLIFYGGNNILNRQEAQDLHCRVSDPTVLVAPSLTEGFDGKEDLARWQIIIKTPYPYIGDKQIKARMDRDYLWYINQVIQTVCQASGRVVRSEIDHGDTYILDLGFEKVLFRYEKYFPIWFLEALTERQVEVEW